MEYAYWDPLEVGTRVKPARVDEICLFRKDDSGGGVRELRPRSISRSSSINSPSSIYVHPRVAWNFRAGVPSGSLSESPPDSDSDEVSSKSDSESEPASGTTTASEAGGGVGTSE